VQQDAISLFPPVRRDPEDDAVARRPRGLREAARLRFLEISGLFVGDKPSDRSPSAWTAASSGVACVTRDLVANDGERGGEERRSSRMARPSVIFTPRVRSVRYIAGLRRRIGPACLGNSRLADVLDRYDAALVEAVIASGI